MKLSMSCSFDGVEKGKGGDSGWPSPLILKHPQREAFINLVGNDRRVKFSKFSMRTLHRYIFQNFLKLRKFLKFLQNL